MQVFKAFFRSLYVHRMQILLYLFIFILILFILKGNSSSSSKKMFSSENLKVDVIDEDQSDLSSTLTEYIDRTEQLTDLPSENLQQIKDDAAFGVIDYALIIPEGFSQKIGNGEYEGTLECISYPQSAGSYLMTRKLDAFLKNIVIYEQSGFTAKEASKMALDTAAEKNTVTMLAADNGSGNEDLFLFFQYVAYSMLMMIIIGIGSVMIEFKEPDLIRRLECSALTKRSRNLQLLFSYLLTGTAVWAVFLAMAFIFYHDGTSLRRIGLYVLNSFVVMLIGLALAFLINGLVKNEGAVNMAANTITLAMCFLSGIFVGQELMQPSVLSFARFLPTYWYVKANMLIRDSSALSGGVWKTFTGYLGIELLFAAAILTAGIVINSRQMKE